MRQSTADSLLLTPGPVSLSMSTKSVMLEDHPMDGDRIKDDVAFCRQRLLHIANGKGVGTAIPLPGSATYANEAVIRTFVPRDGKLLLHANGTYGDRLAEICAFMGLAHAVLRSSPVETLALRDVREALRADPFITHVMVVHCETSCGIVNPIEDIAVLCREAGKGFLIDAVSTFGALPLDMRRLACEAIVLGSNKCLEGPPGLAWVLADEARLGACKGNADSLSFDLWAQWDHLESSGCFRFTPPTHVVTAVAQALRDLESEGGPEVRLARYRRNHRCLVEGLRRIGFKPALADELAAPIVATFWQPEHPKYDFGRLCSAMARRGFHIFPGRLAVPNTLRIGCIGGVEERDMRAATAAIREVLVDMGVVLQPPRLAVSQVGAR